MSDIEVTVLPDDATEDEIIPDAEPAENGETITDSTKPKRYRATKAEMERREKAAIRILSNGPTTMNRLATEANLPYPKAAALVQRLMAEGRVVAVGREKNRTQYRLDPKVTVKPVRQLPATPFANFLDHLHIGQQLRVVGFHVTEKGTSVDVEVEKGEVVHLQPTS